MSEGRQQPVRNAVLPGAEPAVRSVCKLGAHSGVSAAGFFDVPDCRLEYDKAASGLIGIATAFTRCFKTSHLHRLFLWACV